eukprot:scaffold20085_cov58-Phaeocystis_antarctica.AAC.2
MVGTVEQIIDNRLASSSWRKVDASLKYWRPFALAQGWPTIIASGDPLRGGKLAGFVTMLVLTTALDHQVCVGPVRVDEASAPG